MKILQRLKPADSLTILFLSFLIILSLVFYKKIPNIKAVLLTYSVLLVIQAALVKKSELLGRNKITDIGRGVVFPVICVLVIFDSLGWIVHAVNPRDIDPLLIRLDYLIFGGFPTVMMESITNPLLTDVLQLAYSSYYFLPISLGLMLKLLKKEREFDRTVFLILLCFYLSYVGYILFPALGPRYTMDHLHSSELKGLFVTEPIQRILNGLEGIKRDAFPSGHTAIVLVVSGLAYRFHKGFFYATLPVIALLIFSTVYCRYHYAIDVLGGVALAIITFFIGDKFYGRWENGKDISS